MTRFVLKSVDCTRLGAEMKPVAQTARRHIPQAISPQQVPLLSLLVEKQL